MKNIAQRVELTMLRKKMVEIQQKIAKIETNCKHVIVEVGAEPKYGWNGSAVCEDCNTSFGWWCPTSPDHTCYYYTHEAAGYLLTSRFIVLRDGTDFILRDYKGDPEYENDDDCVFCHEPDERK